ncbi:MAG TPA: hypothetical protein VGH63_06060, partial [Polyangia bacterium]
NRTCLGIWGSSPTDVWFACSLGAFHYTGNGTWDTGNELDYSGFSAVWGSSQYDVYVVGTAGTVYHYY